MSWSSYIAAFLKCLLTFLFSVYEDDGAGSGTVEDVLVPITQTNGHPPKQNVEEKVEYYFTLKPPL